eukprot:144126-Chlamydomonas_euryale.AAC.1
MGGEGEARVNPKCADARFATRGATVAICKANGRRVEEGYGFDHNERGRRHPQDACGGRHSRARWEKVLKMGVISAIWCAATRAGGRAGRCGGGGNARFAGTERRMKR